MATIAVKSEASVAGAQEEARQTFPYRVHLITALLATWTVTALFVDFWAHDNSLELDTFFSPWHAAFYGGFTAGAIYTLWNVRKLIPEGKLNLRAWWMRLPIGWRLGLLGIFVVGLGGSFDFVWHDLFGFDAAVEAAFSPPHLILFIGGLMIVSAPAQAAWANLSREPSWREFLPGLLSFTVTTAVALAYVHYHGVIFMNITPTTAFVADLAANFNEAQNLRVEALADTLEHYGDDKWPYEYYSRVMGTSAIMITNVVLIAPMLLAARRWHMPFGAVTFMYAILGSFASIISAFRDVELIIMFVGSGLVADLLIKRLRPSDPDRIAQFMTLAIVVPLVMWSLYALVLALFYGGIAWPETIWSGSIIFAAAAAWGLSILIAPPKVIGEVAR